MTEAAPSEPSTSRLLARFLDLPPAPTISCPLPAHSSYYAPLTSPPLPAALDATALLAARTHLDVRVRCVHVALRRHCPARSSAHPVVRKRSGGTRLTVRGRGTNFATRASLPRSCLTSRRVQRAPFDYFLSQPPPQPQLQDLPPQTHRSPLHYPPLPTPHPPPPLSQPSQHPASLKRL